MKNKFRSQKFNTILFVICSLGALFLFTLLIFIFNINYLTINNSQPSGKYYINSDYNYENPYVTKVPGLKDMITGPIIDRQDPIIGDLNTPVTIVYFSDFECAYCREQEEIFKQILEKYDDRVSLMWKDYPESNESSISYQAAVAARCAQAQEKFWEYHDALFNEKKLDANSFAGLASNLNLDTDDFKNCLKSEEPKNKIKDNLEEANALNIKGIPFIYINDKEMIGRVDIKELDIIIKSELIKSEEGGTINNQNE